MPPKLNLTDEEKLERKEKMKEYKREYYQKNKEKWRDINRSDYYAKNKEKIKQKTKEYYEKNKEKVNEKSKEWRENNKERCKELGKNWRKTKLGIKSGRICKWRNRGIICEDFDVMYEKYANCLECEYCKTQFKDDNDRCLDHDHSITDRPNVRGILCRSCNCKDVLKKNNEE